MVNKVSTNHRRHYGQPGALDGMFRKSPEYRKLVREVKNAGDNEEELVKAIFGKLNWFGVRLGF